MDMPTGRVATVESILDYWFGPLDALGAPDRERTLFWFVQNNDTDDEIRARFAADVERAAAGRFDHWRDSSRGRLALILLLDQIPRNIHRGSPEAFAHDAVAQELALEGIRLGQDRALGPFERAFFYLPLEHAENLDLQERSVVAFSALMQEADPLLTDRLCVFLDYAVRHRDIIARFGRFPHRNRILGRESTPEEVAFLEAPGSSF